MKKTLVLCGSIAILAAILWISPVAAKDKSKSIEKYKANAIVQTGGGASMAEINIYRWSSDDERNEILAAIKEATTADRPNKRHVAQALRGQKKAGYAFMASRQGYPLRYARSFDMGDGKRKIIIATDRPVSFGEVYSHSQLGDYDVTVVVLNVDKDGNGDGRLSVGTEVKWNEETDKIEIANVSSQPVMLGNVRRVD